MHHMYFNTFTCHCVLSISLLHSVIRREECNCFISESENYVTMPAKTLVVDNLEEMFLNNSLVFVLCL